MPSNHLILYCPLVLLPSIFPSIRVFSNESVLHIRWPNIGVSASASVLPMNVQDWFPLGLTSWILLQSKGLSRVFSNNTVQEHQFFSAQLPLQSNFHIHIWLLGKPQPWLDGPLWPAARHFTPQGAFTHWWEGLIQAPSIHHSPSKTCSQPPFGPGSGNTVAWFDLTAWGMVHPDNDLEKRIWDPGGQRGSQRNNSGVLLPRPRKGRYQPMAKPATCPHQGYSKEEASPASLGFLPRQSTKEKN